MRKEFRGGRHQLGAAQCSLEKRCEPLRAAEEAHSSGVRLPKTPAEELAEPIAAPVRISTPSRPPAPPSLGATIVDRELANGLVEHLSRFRIPAEVVEDGRYFRVKTYPIPPEGTH